MLYAADVYRRRPAPRHEDGYGERVVGAGWCRVLVMSRDVRRLVVAACGLFLRCDRGLLTFNR